MEGLYALILIAFTLTLGGRYADPRSEKPGLLLTLALESVVKGLAFIVVGLGAFYGVFEGYDGLALYLDKHPQAVDALMAPIREGRSWGALLVTAFAAAFLLPRQFHLAFVERSAQGALTRGMWVLPAYLLCLNLPIPILLWASHHLAGTGPAPDIWVMTVAEHTGTGLLAFLAGVSASSAMILVCVIALTGMVVHHLILPLNRNRSWPAAQLLNLRRLVMAALVLAGFTLQQVLPRSGSLVDLGLVSFVAVLQLLPPVLATLFWRGASRRGVLWAFAGGSITWLFLTALPLLGIERWISSSAEITIENPRSTVLLGSLVVNALLLGIFSTLWPPGQRELTAAERCSPSGRVEGEGPGTLIALSHRLGAAMGEAEAERLITEARLALSIPAERPGPAAMRRLTHHLQGELATLLGPLAARTVLGLRQPIPEAPSVAAQMEELRELPPQAIELSSAREKALHTVQRYLESVLRELPLGLCAVDDELEVILWNESMATLTAIPPQAALGTTVLNLPPPWGPLLADGLMNGQGIHEEQLRHGDTQSLLRLRPAALPSGEGKALIVEDLTERQQLRDQASHQDRLASVGRLAAGVAHEVLNPLTGVMMVARNLQLEPEAEDAGERLDLILSESRRIEAIVRDLLVYSRKEDERVSNTSRGAERKTIPLADLFTAALRLVSLSPEGRHIRFEVDAPPGLKTRGDRQALLQVLTNLLVNARDASPPQGRVHLCAWPDTDGLFITVRDEGDGVPEAIRHQLFEPFFTTKGPGQGTGLGLSISHRIIEEHRGRLRLLPATQGGATFEIWLPHPTAAQGEDHP